MSLRLFALPAALLAGLLVAGTCGAFTLEEYTFEDPARQQDFRELIGEIRCLVCQNESLAASQADLAQDLRNEIYRLMQEGRPRDEVIDYLVSRYGDFVLYEPPLRLNTLPLWLGPILLAIVGVVLLRRAIAQKRPLADEALSPEEQARLEALLARQQDHPDQDPRT
ncbi:cytochrome c-type biogenesis protein [Thiococcus pfennigii]|jgi:cytochrome c-type biogenesis protein CcmH|uniref:cytochrome c-type biogenesis protein n=1 Tax=Thiococcus pfennigii TaxID=1057 RepID=UPI001904E132|nr:cytochrome c-type biogenesis protein [Thiococcus pfennigii]MBK1701786.1 cytochrome C biogenesis protein [Thiococcus pfennigii]MBK1731159.1 cytochrome C biogenesis protein [Thiococcus pfennigii]